MDSVVIKNGQDLSNDDIEQINQAFLRVFPENELLKFGDSSINSDQFFFIYSRQNQITATGRLRPLTIKFIDKEYRIQGIADVISNIPGKGYGRLIIEAIKNYLLKTQQFGLGFCSPQNDGFYIKCGLLVEPGMMKQFFYQNDKGELVNYNDDVIYFNDQEDFMRQVKDHPQEKVIIPIPHW